MNYKVLFERDGKLFQRSLNQIEQNFVDNFVDKTYLISGTFDNLNREDVQNIVKNFGGKIVTSVSKKLDYLILGDDFGKSKFDKANKFGTNIINKDEFVTKFLT